MIEKATGKKAKVFRFKASLKIDSNFAPPELTHFDENKKSIDLKNTALGQNNN
jgi:hypothetical protein